MSGAEQDRRIVRSSPHVLSRVIAGEHPLVPVRQRTAEMDSIHTANAVGSPVFSLFDGRRDTFAITRKGLESFDVPGQRARGDVHRFIHELCDAGLTHSVEDACR